MRCWARDWMGDRQSPAIHEGQSSNSSEGARIGAMRTFRKSFYNNKMPCFQDMEHAQVADEEYLQIHWTNSLVWPALQFVGWT
jgi:hypothetical protein